MILMYIHVYSYDTDIHVQYLSFREIRMWNIYPMWTNLIHRGYLAVCLSGSTGNSSRPSFSAGSGEIEASRRFTLDRRLID